jgi:hypothetical protein
MGYYTYPHHWEADTNGKRVALCTTGQYVYANWKTFFVDRKCVPAAAGGKVLNGHVAVVFCSHDGR